MKALALLLLLIPAVAAAQQQQEYNGPPSAQLDVSIADANATVSQLNELRTARASRGLDTRDVDATMQSVLAARNQLTEIRNYAVKAGH